MKKGDCAQNIVDPSSDEALVVVVIWKSYVECRFLCAWGREQMMVCAAYDAAGVRDELDVDNL